MTETISVIVPVYNERENLEILVPALTHSLDAAAEQYEIIFVDDGSRDGSGEYLSSLALPDSRLKLIQLRRNFGQTAAMAAGFDYATGDIVVAVDADNQNRPSDISSVLTKLREGYDVVSCWRRHRKDPWITRRVPSAIANLLISAISGVRLHDYGCTLKGYRRELFDHFRLYGEMHRLIPIHAAWVGARVAEIPVDHHPRTRGTSKYGLGRTFKVVLDLITVKLLGSFSTKPMYLFGGAGLLACLGGIVFAGWTLVDKFLNDVKAHRNPLLLLAVFLFLVGIQFILMGLVAELLIRTYYESQGKTPYVVRRTWNCPAQGPVGKAHRNT